MRDYIDYRVRSVAIVRDDEMRPAFQVICYGLSHSDLASVAMPGADEPNMSGGARLRRRLDARGIDTEAYRINVFDTGPLKDEWTDKDGLGRKPVEQRRRLPMDYY
jgi:hypothetical protein